ncbi:MAG: hypothetical protein HFJ42_05735 [Clostridia bacterium]|nr:hypothetical protein [Clostridia bacterium]
MCNSNKDNIIQMYYNEHFRPTDISKALNIDNGYITRIIKQDERYQTEKEQRKQFNKQRNKEQTIAYIKEFRHSQKEEYEILQYQLALDSKIESKNSIISKFNFIKYNSSAYNYNSNKNQFELDK